MGPPSGMWEGGGGGSGRQYRGQATHTQYLLPVGEWWMKLVHPPFSGGVLMTHEQWLCRYFIFVSYILYVVHVLGNW